MKTTSFSARSNGNPLVATARTVLVVAAICLGTASSAWAYVGRSFVEVPGVKGDWKGQQYKGWVSAESNMWKASTSTGQPGAVRRKDWAIFTYSVAPHSGASTLTLAIDKRNPALKALMDRCLKKTTIPELEYAESSDRSRWILEMGTRPADIPEYYEYKLKNVQISDCPVADDAAEQALVLSFADIEWTNFKPRDSEGEMLTLQPALLPPAQTSGKTRDFVLDWFAPAQDSGENQCSALSEKPLEAEYYHYFSKEHADKERARLAPKGGPTYPDGIICMRGPNQLDGCKLPGIVKDPVQPEPQVSVARGINLDGDDGTGKPPAGICKHKNYTSEDGRTGIDNQMFTVEGCMRGYMGHKGQLYQYENEQRRNGQLAIMVEISGIDNDQNDDSVDMTLFYSKDVMDKSASGLYILPDFTFRVSEDPHLTYYFTRMHGKIVNGVITTDPIQTLRINIPLDIPLELHQARVRLQIMPDGTLKGVLGGYQDWRQLTNANNHSLMESLVGTSSTGMYYAMKRAADGGKDPVTGECNEISLAYDIEGTPAFLPAAQQAKLQAGSMILGDNRK